MGAHLHAEQRDEFVSPLCEDLLEVAQADACHKAQIEFAVRVGRVVRAIGENEVVRVQLDELPSVLPCRSRGHIAPAFELLQEHAERGVVVRSDPKPKRLHLAQGRVGGLQHDGVHLALGDGVLELQRADRIARQHVARDGELAGLAEGGPPTRVLREIGVRQAGNLALQSGNEQCD